MAVNPARQWLPLQKQLIPTAKESSTIYQKNAERRHRETIESALRCGYLKCLDKDLIMQSQEDTEASEAATELQYVLRISLDSHHIQVLDEFTLISCMRLRICNLGSCFLRDISAFYGSVNLLKLDVSNNQIFQLPQRDFWSSLTNLRVLYLHGNSLSGRETLSRLSACRILHVLTLRDTPLALIRNYRHHTVNSILPLRALDNYIISDEEIIENLYLSGPFQALTKHFKVQLYIPSPKGVSYANEIRGVYRMLLTVDKVLAKHSPVILLQRHIRGWLVRKALAKSPNPRVRVLAAKALAYKGESQQQKTASVCSQQTGLVISSEKPIMKRPKVPIVPSKSKTKFRSLPPAPPPSSPRHQYVPTSTPVERHVIGIDRESSQAKYFMHINLRQLHKTVYDAQLLDTGVDKHFTAKKKPKSKCDQNKESKISTADDKTVEHLSEESTSESEAVLVSGSPVKIHTHDQQPDLTNIKKREGAELREAEKEILRAVYEDKKPLTPVSIPKKPKISAKTALLFTRASATMTLSTLQSVEQKYVAKKKSDMLKEKANLVAKIKKDRVTRRTKIEKFHRKVCNQARDWKNDEDHRLEEQREKLKEKREAALLRQSEELESCTEKREEQIQEQKHACEFGAQNTMVGSTLDKEDYKALKGNETAEKRDVVREAREQAQEKQEMVKRYMELRRVKLLQEGEEARKALDSKMLEAASNRLMASRRKIDRELARKQAAKEAIAMTKEELRKGPQRPGEALASNKGPSVITDSEIQHVQFSPNRGNTEFKHPPHIRHLHQEAHSTWQRGSRVLDAEGHFPLMHTTSETPLMYGMLQPGAKKTSSVELPVITSETTSLATSNLITSKQLPVR